MSDQTLRQALEKQIEIWQGYTSDNPDVASGFALAADKLAELLAAHFGGSESRDWLIAQVTPIVKDHVTAEDIADVLLSEADLSEPVAQPQPALDEATLRSRLSDEWSFSPGEVGALVALVTSAVRPLPTREQIDEMLQLHRVGPAFRPPDPDRPSALANYRRRLRNALLELITKEKR